MAIENLSVIEQTLQLPEGTLQKAIESTEVVKVELQDLEVFKKEDYTARIENLKNQFQQQGKDFLIKEAKQKYNLEFEGKSIDTFAEKLRLKALEEAKVEPNTKVQELQNDLEKLRKNLEEKDNLIIQKESEFKQKESKRLIKDTLLSKINVETSIPKDDILTILQSKFEVELENDNLIFKQNGEVLKNNTTLNPKTIDEIYAEFLPSYAKQPSGGKGEKNETGHKKANSLEMFNEEMQNKNIAVNSEAYNKEMMQRLSNKTLTI
jgi:hypothetical protein